MGKVISNKVPQLRFPEFSSCIKKTKFGEVVESNLYGPRFDASNYSNEGNVKTIRGTDLTNDGEIKYDQVPLALIDKKTVKSHKLEDGDLVIITTAECGKAAVYRKQKVDFLSSAYGVRFRLNENGSPIYFKYYFQTWNAKKETNKFIRKATVSNLPGSDVLQYRLGLPPILEQEKVATFLSSVDKKISLLKQKHEQLLQYKKGIMQQLFSQQLRFKDDNGQDFPDWDLKKGNKIFNAVSDKDHDSKLPILAITQEYGAIPRDLINYQVQVADTSVAGYKVVDKGDYIISLRSFQGGIEYSNYKGICSPAYIILRPGIEINDDFYRYYLKTNNFIQEMKRRLEGIRDGKILSYKYFSEISLPSPCIDEQNKIADFLDSIDQKINLAQQQVEQTQAYKQGLLQQMFV